MRSENELELLYRIPAGHWGPSGKAMICKGTDHSFFHWGQVHERQLQTSHIRRLPTI
ncbi:hypothetical protein RDI58_001204 [Solanum bulbocastanum]|uniref:Uncharacterized protein n=1 Tax=Solanum bulbocastanum TaxID=147425 RepID=A0AAN8UBG3_SOLBU